MFKRHLFFISFLILSYSAHTQCNYTQPKFSVKAENDVVYGVQTGWHGSLDTLKLDIFKPVGDGNVKRPVVVMIHGGGFSGGNKRDLKLLGEKYASQGMVCISVGYRLGFIRPLSFDYPFALDPAEMLRASYRGQQDAKAAIRFMKARSQQDSTDRDQYYAVGFSAGGFIALAIGYASDSTFKPKECKGIADGINLNGTFKRPDLGPIDGLLNQNGQSASIKGVFNFFGAVYDTSMIKAGGPKLFQYHQTGDPVVPCGYNRPYHGIGLGIPDNYPYVLGSCLIEKRLQNLGSNAPENITDIYTGNKHEVHDIQAYEKLMSQQLTDWICASSSSIATEINQKAHFYPNPVNDFLHLDLNSNELNAVIEMDIFNATMQKIETMSSTTGRFDMRKLPSGVYFIEVKDPCNQAFFRIVKSSTH